jgi:hypothetical protein
LSLSGGVGYHRNDYRTVASGLGAPRRDDVWAWFAGLGRPIGRWAFLRADYRRERRDSNLSAFDIESEAVIVQLGVGLFGPPSLAR